MRTEDGVVRGSVEVSDDFTLRGIADGHVTVVHGGCLDLCGICAGSLTIQPGGFATVRGIVNGDVFNDGGNLDVRGIVCGHVETTSEGVTSISPDARVLDGR